MVATPTSCPQTVFCSRWMPGLALYAKVNREGGDEIRQINIVPRIARIRISTPLTSPGVSRTVTGTVIPTAMEVRVVPSLLEVAMINMATNSRDWIYHVRVQDEFPLGE